MRRWQARLGHARLLPARQVAALSTWRSLAPASPVCQTARDLVRAGCTNIAVLEARDRVGCRSLNQNPGHGLIADAGPTWVGPGQTAIADLLRELGIGTIPNYAKGDMIVYLGGATQRTADSAAPVSGDFMAQIDQLARHRIFSDGTSAPADHTLIRTNPRPTAAGRIELRAAHRCHHPCAAPSVRDRRSHVVGLRDAPRRAGAAPSGDR